MILILFIDDARCEKQDFTANTPGDGNKAAVITLDASDKYMPTMK